MKSEILSSVEDCVRAALTLKTPEALAFMEEASSLISEAFRSGNKILSCGNGGSLCDAMHLAEEFTGFYRKYRKALPAIALCEPGHLTCVGNDQGFNHIFSRGVEAFGKEGDVLILLSTSGNSANLLPAVTMAKEKGLKTIAFLGKTGGKLKGLADLEWIVSGFSWSDRIQEAHMAAIHIIIEQVELKLFTHAYS
jgi:D-sedoheptulose 7-phosphate isomerase